MDLQDIKERCIERKSLSTESRRSSGKIRNDGYREADYCTSSKALEPGSRKSSYSGYDYREISQSRKSSFNPDYKTSSRKSSYVLDIDEVPRKHQIPDLGFYRASIDEPLLESPTEGVRRQSGKSHLDIYRRHSSSASRISAPAGTANRGKSMHVIFHCMMVCCLREARIIYRLIKVAFIGIFLMIPS